MSERLARVLDDVIAWQREAFPGERLVPAAVHLMRELDELAANPASGEEHADALMLVACVLDQAGQIRDQIESSAREHGINLAAEVERKLAINRIRTWAPPDSSGVVEHLRERPSWESYWFDMARLVATRATCPRAAIGAVLVKHLRVIATGYNGVPAGQPHCPDTPEHHALDHCPDAIHAERNALTNAFLPVHGATLYVHGPRPVCPSCRDALVRAGVTDIRWQDPAPARAAREDGWQ